MNKSDPIGMSHPPREPRKYDSKYHRATTLPAQVRLPNSNLGCVSCHPLYASKMKLLTVTTNASKPCFTCHAMD